ncbi:MAG: hypothetical protein ABI355_16700 [Solirubrobacteraceae bacterium]
MEELDRLRTAAAERLLELTRFRGAQRDRGEPNGATEYSPAAKLRIFRGRERDRVPAALVPVHANDDILKHLGPSWLIVASRYAAAITEPSAGCPTTATGFYATRPPASHS